MEPEISEKEIAARLRELYRSDMEDAPRLIEEQLRKILGPIPAEQQADFLERLAREHFSDPGANPVLSSMEEALLERILPLVLGRKISGDEPLPDDFSRQIAESIDAIYDSLNRLIGSINTTLLGRRDDTGSIRQVLPYHLEEAGPPRSLDACFKEIDRVFLASHEAFKAAIREKTGQLLDELDPALFSDQSGGRILNPLRKAKAFDRYERKIAELKALFESGEMMASYCREFEKICGKLIIP